MPAQTAEAPQTMLGKTVMFNNLGRFDTNRVKSVIVTDRDPLIELEDGRILRKSACYFVSERFSTAPAN